jgi:hypothetical protein
MAIVTTLKLVKGGSIVGDNNAGDTSIGTSDTDTYLSFGGSDDLWGNILTPSDVNSSNFGVAVSFTGDNSSPGAGNYVSEYLKVTDFGISVPSEATINGVEVEIDCYDNYTGFGNQAKVDHIRIKVYYTQKSPLPTFFK